jgi:WD40-like Beta Propeller Repeat
VPANRSFFLALPIISGALLAFACSAGKGAGSSVQVTPPVAGAGGADAGAQPASGGSSGAVDIIINPQSDAGQMLGMGDTTPPPTAIPAGGDVLGTGFDPANKAMFAGTPSATAAPTVAYPLAHALFPANLAPVEIHLKRTVVTQTIARVNFHVDGFDLNFYDTCAPAEQDPMGCVLTLPATVCQTLGAANYFGTLTTTIRLADSAGANVGETTLTDVSWTYAQLSGGLYYWTTSSVGASQTEIRRYNFADAGGTPETYWSQTPDSPQLTGTMVPADQAGPHACMGCHAISRDGSKIALSFGGSLPAAFELIDVASKAPIAARLDTTTGYASMTTFSPDNSRLINEYHGKLLLRTADAMLTDVSELFATDTTEPKSHPFWSPTGDSIAFVSFDFTATAAVPAPTGDLVLNSQIWIAPSDGQTATGPAKLLVPRVAGKSSYYPAISDDGKFVVFNQSSCSAPENIGAWGSDPCDGYSDLSARLQVVPAAGGTPVDLAQANGDGNLTNSWPRWSPDHGQFNKQQIYWVAFASRRAYGLRLAGASDTEPQLWFAAVRATPGQPLEADPSYAAVWLPSQNDDMTHPTGNHTPQWVEKVVPIVVK